MNIETISKTMWRIPEVAERIGISVGLVKIEIARGNLKASRIGRRFLFIHKSELERYELEGSRNQERNDHEGS